MSAGQTKTWNAAIGDFTQTVVGGAYENAAFRLMALAGEHKTGRPVAALNNGTKAPFWQVGAFIYVGPGYIPVAYTRVKRNDAQDSSASKIAIGYVYNLSKRTAVYTHLCAHRQQQGDGHSRERGRRCRSDTAARAQLVRHRSGHPAQLLITQGSFEPGSSSG